MFFVSEFNYYYISVLQTEFQSKFLNKDQMSVEEKQFSFVISCIGKNHLKVIEIIVKKNIIEEMKRFKFRRYNRWILLCDYSRGLLPKIVVLVPHTSCLSENIG